MKNECDEEINRIEVEYERKLTHEAIYLEKMRQAYDEYVVRSLKKTLMFNMHFEASKHEILNCIPKRT